MNRSEPRVPIPPTEKTAYRDLERWFSIMHDRMYAEYDRLAKANDWYCKFHEAAMGAHDHAWVKYELFLYDLGFQVDEIRSWRKEEIQKPSQSEEVVGE